MDKMPEIREFDICGQVCPSTLLVALREINANIARLKDGTVTLLFRTNNRQSVATIPESAGNMGLKVDVRKLDTCYEILISGEASPLLPNNMSELNRT